MATRHKTHKTLIAALALAGLTGIHQPARGQQAQVPDKQSPHIKSRGVPLKDVRWTDGFWAAQYEKTRRVVVPSMWRVMQIPDNAATFNDLRMAAGLVPKGKPGGKKWSDGDCHKLVETMAYLYEVSADEELDRMMDDAIDVIAKAQLADGYLSTWVQLEGVERWSDLRHHELYNMGHFMTAASVHHRATGKDSYLELAIRVGDYLYDVFSPHPKKLAHFGFNPSNIMGAVDLYRATGNPKYLELAGIFVDMRGSVSGGDSQNQAGVPLRKESEAVGHAVTGTYLWNGAADVYAETGEKALLVALEKLWDDVTNRKMYVTGGIAAIHHGTASRGWPRDSVHEAFGKAYQLPNRTAYNETCSSIGYAMWGRRMLGLTGEAKYADGMERVLYNSMLSAMGSNGTTFFYTNPLRRCAADIPLLSNDSPGRWTDTTPASPVNCYCCPPNVARTLAKLQGWAYSVSDAAVWVNLYGGNTLETKLPGGDMLKLTQQTNYPWDGVVKITMREAASRPMSLMLRVPGWARNAKLQINGKPTDIELDPGRYATVRRRWAPGDTVELDLPMPTTFLRANPLVEAAHNQVAVTRGPLVYCLESTDLPKGVGVDDVTLVAGPEWTPRQDWDFLGGATFLEGPAKVTQPIDWSGDALYLPWDPNGAKQMTLRLIPYYKWANRGVSEMQVWLPAGP